MTSAAADVISVPSVIVAARIELARRTNQVLDNTITWVHFHEQLRDTLGQSQIFS